MLTTGPRLLVDRHHQSEILEEAVRRALLRKQAAAERGQRKTSIVEWAQERFYLPETGKPIGIFPHQRAVLLLAFPPDAVAGHFPYVEVTLSSVKKSGKTTLAAVIGRWFAEEQTRLGHIYCMGNDMRQAQERSFSAIVDSLRATPGYVDRGGEGFLSGQWNVRATKLRCQITGTSIEAVGVDARGEAGANPDLTIWTELWGFEGKEAVRFYHEMTPVPTKPSIRLVESYAGFEGESELLRSIYDRAQAEGRQLTAGEVTERTGVPLGAFEEAAEPDDLVPIWVNDDLGIFMYWDSGPPARRMPWQRGDEGRRYYTEQEATLPAPEYTRLHGNEWTGGMGDFIPMPIWDACREELPPLESGDRTPAVLGVDAATTGDCFGVVLVTRHPDPERHGHVAIRAARKWTPPKGGRIDYEGPEAFLRVLCQGGCAMGHPQSPPFHNEPAACPHQPNAGRACHDCCPACRDGVLIAPYNILQIAYDPYQLESMMQRFRKEGITWCKSFDQGKRRMQADSALYDLIINRELAHTGDLALREHIQNAQARHMKHEDSKMRLEKREAGRKIDLAVAASMACFQARRLNM